MDTAQEQLIHEIATVTSAHIEFICRSENFESMFNCTSCERIEADYKTLRPIRIEFENNLKSFFTSRLSQTPDELQLLHQQVVGKIDPSQYRATIEGINQEDIFTLMSIPVHSVIFKLSICYFSEVYLRGKKSRSEKKALHCKWANNILRAAFYPELFPKDGSSTSTKDTSLQSDPYYNYLKGAIDGFIINELESRLKDKSQISRSLEAIRLGTDELTQVLVAQLRSELDKASQPKKICG